MNDKANVLIVDDEEVVRLSHLRSLQSADCNARTAGDGTEAINVMEQHPFDVVLLDLRMPGLDGMDVLKTIKQRWPDSEVVVSQVTRALKQPRRQSGWEHLIT